MVSKYTIIPIIQVHFSNSEGGFGADSGPADQNGLSGESGSIPEDTHFFLDILVKFVSFMTWSYYWARGT